MFFLFSIIQYSSYYDDFSDECGVKCWINRLNITLTDVYEYTSSNFYFSIPDLNISNIQLLYIDARFPDPAHIGNITILEFLVSANLKGDLNATAISPIHIVETPSFEAEIDNVSVIFSLEFGKQNYSNTALISTVNCTLHKLSIEAPDIEVNFDSAILQGLYNTLIKPVINNVVKNYLGSLLNQTIETNVSELLTEAFGVANEYIEPYINDSHLFNISYDDSFLDLRTSVVVDALRFMLNNFTGIDGPLNLNALINRFTNNTGEMYLSTILDYFNISLPFSFNFHIDDINADIELSLVDLFLYRLNTWGKFDFLEPLDDPTCRLNTTTGMTDLGINVSFQINVSANGTVISTGGEVLSENSDLDMYLTDNQLDLQVQVAYPKGNGLNYTDAMCLNLDCIEDLLAENNTGVTLIQFQTEVDSIEIVARDGQILEEEIRTFINNIAKFLVENYRDAIAPFVTGFVNELGVSTLNDKLDEFLSKANCSYIPNEPYKQFVLWTTSIAFSAAVIITFTLYVLVEITYNKKGNRYGLDSSSLTTISQTGDVNDSESEVEHGRLWEFFRNDDKSSLLMTRYLPEWVRFLIVFLIFVNVTLFVTSNTGIGASVFIKIEIGKKKLISFPSLFNFSLMNSVTDMWKATAYFLSILIMCMSCLWPYFKLALMFITWILPETILSIQRREKLLRFLDALGKWSLVDSFVMILMLIAFNVNLAFPITSPYVPSPLVVHVWVFPAYGFCTLIVGTIFSLAMSHVMLAFHRHVENCREKYKQRKENGSFTESLSQTASASASQDQIYLQSIGIYSSDNLRYKSKYQALIRYCNYNTLKILVTIILLAAFVLLIFGLISYSFSFDFVGLAGWALNLLGYPHKKEYSVIDLARKLQGSVEHPHSYNVVFTLIVYIIIAISMPIIHLTSLLVMWLVPMTFNFQKSLYVACEVMYAWSCLDVFVVSILAAVMEISQLARFMVGDKCDMIDPIVKLFFSQEDLIVGHETCFDVITVLLKGSWLLFAAAIFQNFATVIVNIVARKALEARKRHHDIISSQYSSTNSVDNNDLRQDLTNDDDVNIN